MSLRNQLKQRRQALGLTQNDMYMRVGMSRQQYQHIESKGNPRLDTLELIAQGLDCQLMLIPKDKLQQVRDVLNQDDENIKQSSQYIDNLINNPWQGMLDDIAD